MTAYGLSEKKNKLINRMEWLRQETDNDAGTVLLSNDEVEDIVDCMKECVDFINLQLASVKGWYREIGTIEEFKELKEKNEPKKVDEDYCCPICHTCGMDDDGIKGTYCTDCGQKLDWQ